MKKINDTLTTLHTSRAITQTTCENLWEPSESLRMPEKTKDKRTGIELNQEKKIIENNDVTMNEAKNRN